MSPRWVAQMGACRWIWASAPTVLKRASHGSFPRWLKQRRWWGAPIPQLTQLPPDFGQRRRHGVIDFGFLRKSLRIVWLILHPLFQVSVYFLISLYGYRTPIFTMGIPWVLLRLVRQTGPRKLRWSMIRPKTRPCIQFPLGILGASRILTLGIVGYLGGNIW